jgi:hypothetical protein
MNSTTFRGQIKSDLADGSRVVGVFLRVLKDILSVYGNCSSQPPHLTEELPQWLSGPSLVTPAAESPPDTKPGQTVFYAQQILFNYRHRLTKNA